MGIISIYILSFNNIHCRIIYYISIYNILLSQVIIYLLLLPILFFFVEVGLIYNIILVSVVSNSDTKFL